MTAAELMEMLKKVPPEMEVQTATWERCGKLRLLTAIAEIEVFPDGRQIFCLRDLGMRIPARPVYVSITLKKGRKK